MSATAEDLTEVIIRPIRGAEPIRVREVWSYRSLLFSLVLKDLRLTFDALHLGFMWPLIRPLTMAMVVVLFKNATSAETGEALPYMLFVYSGVVVWFYFAETLNDVASGLQRDSALLMKVYYPRIISPLVSIFSSLFELSIQLFPLIVMMVVYRVGPDWHLLLFPVVLLQLTLFTLGCGLILSYLAMHVRDFERAVSLVLYVGIWVSPVFHSLDILPKTFLPLSSLNPMLGTLGATRSVLFARTPFPWNDWAVSCGATLVVLWVGLTLFKRLQHKIVELL
jgi:homopolymeric O-antigen transport system permease protein